MLCCVVDMLACFVPRVSIEVYDFFFERLLFVPNMHTESLFVTYRGDTLPEVCGNDRNYGSNGHESIMYKLCLHVCYPIIIKINMLP